MLEIDHSRFLIAMSFHRHEYFFKIGIHKSLKWKMNNQIQCETFHWKDKAIVAFRCRKFRKNLGFFFLLLLNNLWRIHINDQHIPFRIATFHFRYLPFILETWYRSYYFCFRRENLIHDAVLLGTAVYPSSTEGSGAKDNTGKRLRVYVLFDFRF